jgi:predicted ATPase
MPIRELHVAGYRSARDLRLKFQRINVLVGPNGCGKTNLYRAMLLLAAGATGQLARMIVEEGGMPSVLWAGDRKKVPVRMTLGVALDQLSYTLTCGLPIPLKSAFNLDPQVKEETIRYRAGGKELLMLERGISSVWARDGEGRRVHYPMALLSSESVLTQLREPHRFPQVSALREEILTWRFYHHFRTDPDSPLRQPQVGIRTPILSHDGHDVAAALETIREIGDWKALDDGIEGAFPGASLEITSDRTRFSLSLQMPGFRRPFDAQELSDGTLRYLCLLAALLSPRPPAVLALNEPETSIHPDLLDPLARLIARASNDSQLWITTHSERLAQAVEQHSGVPPVALEKVNGATRVVGQRLIEPEPGEE